VSRYASRSLSTKLNNQSIHNPHTLHMSHVRIHTCRHIAPDSTLPVNIPHTSSLTSEYTPDDHGHVPGLPKQPHAWYRRYIPRSSSSCMVPVGSTGGSETIVRLSDRRAFRRDSAWRTHRSTISNTYTACSKTASYHLLGQHRGRANCNRPLVTADAFTQSQW
jgi:hypothetical protein